MEINLNIIGFILITLGLIHVFFPRYFNWANELSNVSLINRQMIYVHTFFIALMLLLMGLLCLISSEDLVKTKLGGRLALGLAIFWASRLFVQFFVYSSKLWKGKTFETAIHILFSLLWMYLSVVFFYVYLTG
jgi:hypothetical protein